MRLKRHGAVPVLNGAEVQPADAGPAACVPLPSLFRRKSLGGEAAQVLEGCEQGEEAICINMCIISCLGAAATVSSSGATTKSRAEWCKVTRSASCYALRSCTARARYFT